MAEPLERELLVYRANIENWREGHLGEFVLIHEDDVVGFFATLDRAFKKGTELFGTAPFFVKGIVAKDRTNISFLGKSIRSA